MTDQSSRMPRTVSEYYCHPGDPCARNVDYIHGKGTLDLMTVFFNDVSNDSILQTLKRSTPSTFPTII